MAGQPNNPENRQGVGPVDPNEVLADILAGVGPADSADPIYPELEGVDEEALQDVRSSSYQVEDEPEVVPEPEVHPEAVPEWVRKAAEANRPVETPAEEPRRSATIPSVVGKNGENIVLSAKERAAMQSAALNVLRERRRLGLSDDDVSSEGYNL